MASSSYDYDRRPKPKPKTYVIYSKKPDPTMAGITMPLRRAIINKLFKVDDYGVYLLLGKGVGDVWIVIYVGRGNLKQRLIDHITDQPDAKAFRYNKLDGEDEGWREECRLFHRYGKTRHLANKRHPPVPPGSGKKHPKCSVRNCNGEAD